jgi:hypothetical protein
VDKWRIPRDELSAKASMIRFAAPSLLSGAVSTNNRPRGEMHRFIAIDYAIVQPASARNPALVSYPRSEDWQKLAAGHHFSASVVEAPKH